MSWFKRHLNWTFALATIVVPFVLTYLFIVPAIILDPDIESLASFENPASWEALRESVLKSESAKVADVSDQDGVFEFKVAKAKAAMRKLLTTWFEESVTIDKPDTSTLLLKSERPSGFMGEVVILYGQPIHCCFIKGA